MRYCASCGVPIPMHKWGPLGKPPPSKPPKRGGRIVPVPSFRLCPIRRVNETGMPVYRREEGRR